MKNLRFVVAFCFFCQNLMAQYPAMVVPQKALQIDTTLPPTLARPASIPAYNFARRYIDFITATVFINDKNETVTIWRDNYTNHIISQYRGSILFKNYFQKGVFKSAQGNKIEAYLLYNLVADEIVAKINGKDKVFSNADFSIGKYHFKAINGRYYESISEDSTMFGKVKLFRKYVCQEVSNFESRNRRLFGFSFSENDLFAGKYEQSIEYYIQVNDDKLRKISMKNGSMVIAYNSSPVLGEYLKAINQKFSSINEIQDFFKNKN